MFNEDNENKDIETFICFGECEFSESIEEELKELKVNFLDLKHCRIQQKLKQIS